MGRRVCILWAIVYASIGLDVGISSSSMIGSMSSNSGALSIPWILLAERDFNVILV